MDESSYERLAADTFKRVLDLFEHTDPDDADVDAAGDVIRVDLRGGRRIVLNTQRPVRQLWLAGGQSAWHFSYDAATGHWLDDKGRGELFEVLRQLARDGAGLELA
jgi:iron-sulfur cluster assembly protein CyaY